jgi:DNA-binding beta-propeller fold protein YncE
MRQRSFAIIPIHGNEMNNNILSQIGEQGVNIRAPRRSRSRLGAAWLGALVALGAGAGWAQTPSEPVYQFTTVAGQPGGPGYYDATRNAARFDYPAGVAVDSAGNVYVADLGNNQIRRITPGGLVTTLARQALGSTDQIDSPNGVAVDSAGNVYVADSDNHTIRKVTPDGVVTTLAGRAGSHGSADGTRSAARFYQPSGVAVDSAGNVFVADYQNGTIRKITPDGVVTTLAGRAGYRGSADGTGSAARFQDPSGVAVDSGGNVFVTDYASIRKITPGGVVTTLAGHAWSTGTADGTGSVARFDYPSGLAVDSAGNVFVADTK